MGGEQSRKRKFLLFYIALCIMITNGACTHGWIKQHTHTADPIARANTFMSEENFGAALKEVERFLNSWPKARGYEALYLKGIIYAHPKNPNRDEQHSLQSFQALIKTCPESDKVVRARAWISLIQTIKTKRDEIMQLKEATQNKQKEIDELKTQLDELKKIDLGTADKKKGATTP